MSSTPSPDTVEQIVSEDEEFPKEKSTVRFDEKAAGLEIIVELQDGGKRNRPLEFVRSFQDVFTLHNAREAVAVMVKFGKFVGPGTIITVAYIDPDNFQTAVSSGAQFQYKLLFMVLISNLIAIYLQVCQPMAMSGVKSSDIPRLWLSSLDQLPEWIWHR
jgi:metal iron transporter